MSAPPPLERVLLSPAERQLSASAIGPKSLPSIPRRLEILEAAASLIGGFSLRQYREKCLTSEPQLSSAKALGIAEPLIAEISKTGIPAALALSALSREPLSKHQTRTAGAHYTDFRLALLIGRLAVRRNQANGAILDPACGAGMLLAATAILSCESGQPSARWLAEKVIAADQSANALRGAQLSLASLTNDTDAIADMSSRWLRGDSLLRPKSEWLSAVGSDLGVIVANPPWEKLKVLRHEFETAAGAERHYGEAHSDAPSSELHVERARVRGYVDEIIARYPLAGRGETDLFVAFTQMMVELAENRASIAALLPAGLIRSKSTTDLRKFLFDRFGAVSFTVLDNKPRFFEIDTRFKFVAITAEAGDPSASKAVRIGFGQSTADGCEPGPFAEIDLQILQRIRPDLSIPEVRNEQEWDLFRRMTLSGCSWATPSSPWWPHVVREVDMTRERRQFKEFAAPGALPLVEGRMVGQFRFGAKVYVEGSGRRAVWTPVPLGVTSVSPQFWIQRQGIPKSARERVDVVRAGFCDIAGQTNERSMTAAVIPSGVVCGNKVPTVLFPNVPGEDALHLWCAMVNSFAFDWMLRRVLTTTVNYFLLQSVPLPPLLPNTLPGLRVAADAKQIAELSGNGTDDTSMDVARLRRDVDLACFRAYGLGDDDAKLLMMDFPSLDRAEPPLPGEKRSTVTRDFILSAIDMADQETFARRCERALEIGARPYRPSQSTDDETSAGQPLRAAT